MQIFFLRNAISEICDLAGMSTDEFLKEFDALNEKLFKLAQENPFLSHDIVLKRIVEEYFE